MSEASQKTKSLPSKNKPQSLAQNRLKSSIKHDAIHPADYLKYNMPWACEDCTHFNSEITTCTIGYQPKWHRREYQKHTYELNGHMALCRFQEID